MPTQRFNALVDVMPKIAAAVNEFPQHLQETVYNAMVAAIHKDIDDAVQAAASNGHSTRSGAVRLQSTHYPTDKTPEWEQRTARNPVASSGDNDGK